MNSRFARGLYAITPDWADTARLIAVTQEILLGGAVLLQYRNKSADAALALEQADRLLTLCKAFGVPLLINDDIDLAATIGADGAHIGRDDGSLETARLRLGPAAVLGVSCYGDLALAQTAAAAGADYVAFGAMYASPTKPQAPVAPHSLLGEARALGKPVACIGGIRADNAATLLAAGADLLAVISDIYDAEHPRDRASQYTRLFRSD